MQNNQDILAQLDLETTLNPDKSENISEVVEKVELNEEIKEENNINTQELELFTDEVISEKKEIEEEIKEKTESTIFSKAFSFISFAFKYVLTSSLIFGVLLLVTNYQAYYNIAESYVFKNQLEEKSKGLITSVQASNIRQKANEEIQKDIQASEESKNEVINKNNIKNLIKESDKNEIDLDINIVPYENRIVIPKIGKNIPLLDIKNKIISGESELNNIFMKELENGVIRYPGSAKPGKAGNTFIFGHSSNFPWMKGDYNDVFSLLDNVVFNDEIIVYYNQKKYKYIIRQKQVVTPGDVSILKGREDQNTISIMTCWPIGTTLNRLVVTGELVEEK